MNLDSDGATHVPGLFDTGQVAALRDILADLMTRAADDRPGLRFDGNAGLAKRIAPATALARETLGKKAQPVRATGFDKSRERNWALGWHQDRSIAVKSRADVPGFARWTRKANINHVEPPTDLLTRMLTLRIHLDPVDEDNGPVFVAPGTHALGRIAEREIGAVVDAHPARMCPAQTGDVWVYRSLILHASARAVTPTRRRVLQVMYSADALPRGLEWLGV